MKLFVSLILIFGAASSFAASTVELPPGGSTTVAGVTVICMKSRLPLCSLHHKNDSYEIWSDDAVVARSPKIDEALSWLKEMRLLDVCR